MTKWRVALFILACAAVPRVSAALSLNQTGYSASQILELTPDTYEDMEVDPSGRLYFATAGGIKRLTAGAVSAWSAAPAYDLELATTGGGYGSGGSACHCIWSVQADGSYASLHQDGLEWTDVALTPDGTLFASLWAGTQQGLYVIDRTSGTPTLLVSGGPGPGGTGLYFGMTAGADGKLYVLGGLELYRLDGSQLAQVATIPHAGRNLTLGPGGVFYVAAEYQNGAGYPAGEVWIVDPVTGETSLLASSGSYLGLNHPTFGSVGYDSATGTLYVTESYKLWAITKNGTPAVARTWGSIKAGYR